MKVNLVLFCFIYELISEQQSAFQHQISILLILPFVMLHMLDFLCCAHVDQMRAQAAVDDLQVLVHHDPGVLVLSTCIPERHLEDPRDLSTDGRESPGCHILLPTIPQTNPNV